MAKKIIGWLDKYSDGGPVQENYNDNTTSYPPGFVGMGNNTQGRNYSPAWGGSFEDGGSIPQAQKGTTLSPIYVNNPNDPRLKSYNDSLSLYNFTQLQKQLEKKENNAKEIVNPSLWQQLTGNYNKLTTEGQRKQNILKAEALKAIKNSDTIKSGVFSSPIKAPFAEYNNRGSYDIYSEKIKPLADWIGYAKNNDYSNVNPQQQVILGTPPQKTTVTKKIPSTQPKPEFKIKHKNFNVQSIGIDKNYNPQITELQHTSINLPPIQNGKYRVEYYDPSIGDTTHQNFMTQAESDAFTKELGQRRMEGTPSAGNITQRVEYRDGGSIPQAQKGKKVSPIYTENPKKVKSYNDSLSLYNKFLPEKNKYLDFVKSNQFNPEYIVEWETQGYVDKNIHPNIGAYKYGILKNSGGGYDRDAKGNPIDFNFFPTIGGDHKKIYSNSPEGQILNKRYPIYKKPVQPYLLQKSPSIKPNQFTQQQLINPNTEFNPQITKLQHPDITLPTIAPRFPKGDYQYVYGPANSTIGRNYNGQFYPEDIPEQRGKVNQPDLDLLNNDTALRKYVQQKSLKYAMGGSIPGATGFSYGRIGDIPSNGKYAKKTLASAQNGKEMSYYQNGLDWKPRNISRDGSVIKDDMGYWNPNNHGKVVEISSPDITMEGVYQPLLGISDTGDTKLMKPGKNYKFKGKKVTEFPVGKNGVNQQDQKTYQQLDQLTNFTNYNKPTSGGWLDKYN